MGLWIFRFRPFSLTILFSRDSRPARKGLQFLDLTSQL